MITQFWLGLAFSSQTHAHFAAATRRNAPAPHATPAPPHWPSHIAGANKLKPGLTAGYCMLECNECGACLPERPMQGSSACQGWFSQTKAQTGARIARSRVKIAENASEMLKMARNRTNFYVFDVTSRYASIHTGGLAVKPQPLSNVWPIVSVAEANGPMQLLPTYSSMFIGILTLGSPRSLG